MENQNNMSPEEIDELKKSLTTLGLEQTEIDGYIEKAMNKSKEYEPEGTVEEKAKETGEENKESVKEEKPEEKIEKSEMGEEGLEKACGDLKMKKAEIEKAISDLEEKMGKKKEPEEIKKSIDTDIEKSFGEKFNDIEKSFGERFNDIEKALTSLLSEEIGGIKDIVKGLQDEVKKIGDTPLGTKSVFTSANFFEKGTVDDLSNEESKELSITKDRDDLLKGMQDMLNKEKDNDVRQMLSDGISDYTVNTVPTSHGIRALAYLSRKKNITLGQ